MNPPQGSPSAERELELLIREARRRQRRRRLAAALVFALVAVGVYLGTQAGGARPRPGSLLSRPLRFPSLGPGGRCPVTGGYVVNNPYFVGDALGKGPVRVLIANWGDVLHGRPDLGKGGPGPWRALQTLWFAMPGYKGPFVVRGARLDKPGPIEVQPGESGQGPGSGPLVVLSTSLTNRLGNSPALMREYMIGNGPSGTLAYPYPDGYRTVPGSTWVKSPGCYGWQVDGRGFSEHIVVDATAPRGVPSPVR